MAFRDDSGKDSIYSADQNLRHDVVLTDIVIVKTPSHNKEGIGPPHMSRSKCTYRVSPVDLFVSLAIPPIACLALRGTAKEFMRRFILVDTPSMSGSVWNANPFVS